MGAGIAQVCATAGYQAIIFDTHPEALQKAESGIKSGLDMLVGKGKLDEKASSAILSRIRFTEFLMELKADIIIEAVIEKLEVKRQIFRELQEFNASDCIFATNTSSIPITQIAYGIKNPERVVGMHFFNPAQIMKLIEVISGAATSPEVAGVVFELSAKLGKTPIHAQDSPGFVVNRVARHYYVESLKILEERVAPFNEIDDLLESAGFRMGAFRLMDLIGVDTNFSVTSSMFEQFHQDPKFRPSRIQKQKVDGGFYGKKSGQGFYKY